MTSFREGHHSASFAAERLGIGRTRFYELYAAFLRSCATRTSASWSPGLSGGDRSEAWPKPVVALARKLLGARPPAAYRFVASEMLRRLQFQVDPASVRRWALAHDLAHDSPRPRPKAATRRWQSLKLGALWQLDASPHPWFLHHHRRLYPLLDLLDDCTRLCTGARLYHAENLLAYLDFLPAAFCEYGLPLELYVDCHSLFFPQNPDSLTQLGSALHFYGISLRYAHTPQAKGKVERLHLYWQRRLPSLFSAESILTPEAANPLLQDLRLHRNRAERHREIAMTPDAAAKAALREGRSVLRPVPRCPWWPYVWSQRTNVKVGSDGRVPVGTQRLPVGRPPGSRLVHCLHPDGNVTILANEPTHRSRPQILLTTNAF